MTPCDTIYALASGAGRAGIAVIRVSGPQAMISLEHLTHRKDWAPRKTHLVRLKNPDDDRLIDEAVIIPFPAPHSYTGEDVVEYHIHGGKAVRDSLFTALQTMDAHRMAESGEFTRRAFENGRMDLTQAEAVGDLIHAETEAQKQLALNQMGGALADLYHGWADQLIKALAYAEAQIDFSEDDLPEDEVKAHVLPVLESVSNAIQNHLDDGHRGERLREGIKIAIIGAPNAGKSSLLNALANRDVAIVSDMAGTTRDALEVHIDLEGYPITFIDTAGLRPEELSNHNAHDYIEAEGIKRALKIAQEADLKILLFDGTKNEPHQPTLDLFDEQSFIVFNKIDDPSLQGNSVDESIHGLRRSHSLPHNHNVIELSVKMGHGLDTLLENVSRETKRLFDSQSNQPSLTRARHRTALTRASESINRALEGHSPDLIAEDIRLAVRHIGEITGRVDVEDLLDIIFKDFCIGK